MTDAVGIVRKRYKQPTATHVEALTGNFLDGEFDPPPSPPASYARDDNVAGESFVTSEGPQSMAVRVPARGRLSRESRTINLNGKDVSYVLQRSTRRRRTIQLQLDPEEGLKVLVPHTLTEKEIEDFLIQRSDWILEHRVNIVGTENQVDWGNGGTTMLRGRTANVVVKEREWDDFGRDLPPTVAKSLEGDTVEVTIPPGIATEERPRIVRRCLEDWYRQEAWDHLRSRVGEFGNVMGVKPSQLKLSNAKKRWGSCSGNRSINLNWRLIMLDDRLIDYVVVHELSHLIELNHSADFWKIVEGVIPDHKELRRKLRRQAPSGLG